MVCSRYASTTPGEFKTVIHVALTYTGPIVRHVVAQGRSFIEDGTSRPIKAAAVFYRRVLLANNVVKCYHTTPIPTHHLHKQAVVQIDRDFRSEIVRFLAPQVV